MMIEFIGNFHFLRPFFLFGIPVLLVAAFYLAKQQSLEERWKHAISPHLLPHLVVQQDKKQINLPKTLFLLTVTAVVIACAGPTWKKQKSPFVQNNAPVVFVLELSQSMLSQDIQPTRIRRALHKIHDFIEEGSASQIGLIVYSGSAHIVVPITKDTGLLSEYLKVLSPSMMPSQGSNFQSAYHMAHKLLKNSQVGGTIIVMTDGITSTNIELEKSEKLSQINTLIYGIGTAEGGLMSGSNTKVEGLNERSISEAVKSLNATRIEPTVDNADAKKMATLIEVHLDSILSENKNIQWVDAGYYLTWPIGFLILLWSRRGWTLRW